MAMSIVGKTLCFTGTLQITRANATKAAKSCSASVSSSITAKTEILVAGPGAGSKLGQAQAKGLEIWTEEEFNSAVENGGVIDPSKGAKAKPKPKSKPKKKAAVAAGTPSAKRKKVVKAEAESDDEMDIDDMAACADDALEGGGGPEVMRCVPNAENFTVHTGEHGNFDVKLAFSDGSGSSNNNKFYRIQLLNDNDRFHVVTNWGRLGEPGASKIKEFEDEADAIQEFGKAYRAKTKNTWGEPFVRHDDKYESYPHSLNNDGLTHSLSALSMQHPRATLQSPPRILVHRLNWNVTQVRTGGNSRGGCLWRRRPRSAFGSPGKQPSIKSILDLYK